MRKGFSLIEIMILIGIFAMLVAIGTPIGIEVYRDSLLDSDTNLVLSVVRRTQEYSFSNRNMVSHGVFFQNDKLTVFQGGSYASRTLGYDEEFPLSGGTTVTAPPEIVFSPLSGSPAFGATITISNGAHSRLITINAQGAVVW